MKKFKLFAASLGLMTLAACSNTDDVFNGADEFAQAQLDENAIKFSTYLGQSATTRAGATGSIDTEKLKGATYGFGVFGYYTGTQTYNDKTSYTAKTDGTSGQSSLIANFMFNQQVTWDSGKDGQGYVTQWTYSPLKYWPNEVQKGVVDDQDDDTGNDPAAAAAYENGGNLTFFAYAPYVNAAISPTTDGIVAINGETTLAAANVKQQDPILTYIVPADGSKMVDLLWGTYGNTSANVNGVSNTGVAYSNAGGATEYEKSILPHWTNAAKTTFDGYRLNADLTKQKTNGVVNFAFKHALAKVGGSETYSTLSGGTTHGLMVQLDLDDLKGAENGGTKDVTTVVTITDINIQARALYDADVPANGIQKDEYLKSQRGDFNLATGQWGVLKTDNTGTSDKAAVTVHNITSPASDGGIVSSATLNETLAEPASVSEFNSTSGYLNGTSTLVGVLTTPKNVYQSETNPLVFIPGTYPELTITVNYTVRTFDANLANAASGEGSWTKVKQVITKRITFTDPVELNKQYNLLMHLGLTGVKFTATVSDWQVDGDDNGNGQIDGPTETLKQEDVYLPINVGEAKASLAFPASSETKTINVSGGTTSLDLSLTGLTNPTLYTVTKSGTVSGDDFSKAVNFTTTGGQTEKAINVGLAPNTGTSKVTRRITVTNETSKTLTIDIVQAPLPLVAVVASPFNAELSNTTHASSALFSSLKDAAGNNVLGSATLTVSAGDTWVTPSSQSIAVTANTGAARSATVTATVNDVSADVIIRQAKAD